jgi:Branched-chain amino acid transport system / permease component
MTVDKQTTTEPDVEREAGSHAAPSRRKLASVLGLDRFSGLYVWAALILIFSLWVPSLFDTATNVRIIAGSQAITAIVAMGLIVPVACGAFDLSIAGTLGVSTCVVIWFQANHHGWFLGIIVALLIGLLVGAVNSLIVVRLHVDSFIGTLGMSSILLAGTEWITGGSQIANGVSPTFTKIGQNQLFGLPLPVFYMIALAIVLWWLLEYTPAGRYPHRSHHHQRLPPLRPGGGVRGRHPRLPARLREPGCRRPVPAARILRRLPRCDAGLPGPGQRAGHPYRDLPARHRSEGSSAGRRSLLHQRPVQRRRPDHRGGPGGPRPRSASEGVAWPWSRTPTPLWWDGASRWPPRCSARGRAAT